MSKNIYKMLNEVNIDLQELKNEEFTDFDKNKAKKNLKKSLNKNTKNQKHKKYILTTSILLMSMCLMNDNFVSYAKEIIYDISYNISKALGTSSNLEDYKNVINKSVSKNGLRVTLNEVVLNNDEIVFSYTVKSKKNLRDAKNFDVIVSGLYINNKQLSSIGGSGSEYIDNYTVESVEQCRLFGIEEDELRGDVDVKVEFSLMTEGEFKGKPWIFEFKANGKQLALDTEEIKINKSIELESGAKLILDKYTKNDIGEKIYAKIENYDENKYYDIYIEGIDDSKTNIKFLMGNCNNNEPMLERFDESSSLDIKNINLSIYIAEVESGFMPNKSDYKKVDEEFIIK
ncbi:DUF4179 domain-containing protein [Romboutsia lituseburensis]|uniref:DUF4179 domain-containing protein n=1 Tax=Romboutsia lituseburensis TaxID=1537 RepID=UPI00215A2056|nr:DUF4179 domain-containing protein [Romboutsia lituseburensis]MCR8746901.1 DUF4179 domain-containing protein [Romboutsia lituseburensis]